MFDFFGRLFGTTKAAETLVDNISNGMDKLFYTDEEKSEAHAKDVSEGRKVLLEWLRGTQGQNLSRRLIALSVTFVWLLQYIAIVCINISINFVDRTELVNGNNLYVALDNSSKVIGQYANGMNGAVMLILGFYFAAPHLSQIVPTAMTKFGNVFDTPKKDKHG